MSGYNSNRASHVSRASTAFTSGDGWGWNDPEADDYLHNPDPKRDGKVGVDRHWFDLLLTWSRTTGVARSLRGEESPTLAACSCFSSA